MQDHQDFFQEQVATYRRRLLNLSLRNRLLNFKYSARGRNFIRVVNTQPDLFLGALKERPLEFVALPPRGDVPEDEKTHEFQHALEQAKLGDEVYLSTLESLDDEGDLDLSRRDDAELELRKRLRTTLGLPPRDEATRQSVQDWARDNGINPDYELSYNQESLVPVEQSINIQTLLFNNDLDRTLKHLRQLGRESMQEMGINTLYVALGFLEWYEDENSRKPILAPLLLHPVDFEQTQRSGKRSYTLKSVDDETESNYSLQERLKSFGVTLPEFCEEKGVEAYFRKVQRAIEQQSRWRVRRYITITTLSFSRMVLYQDLDPSKNLAVGRHPLVQDLLVGTETLGADYAEVYDVEAESIAAKLKPVIFPADSSQLSAIKDVLDGKNLVVKGPPGTGKSQTITNIIAALLDKGQSVLFVAEKMAALEVVKNRLDSAGLGAFCLELHSFKARRNDVVASFKQRLQVSRSTPKATAIEEKRAALKRDQERLNEYARVLNESFGTFGLSVHNLLWQLQILRKDSELPDTLKLVPVPDVVNLTSTNAEQIESSLKHFQQLERELRETWQTQAHHPWYGLASADLNLATQQRLILSVSEFAAHLSEMQQVLSTGETEGIIPNLPSPAHVQTYADTYISLDELDDEVDATWLIFLRDARARKDITELVEAARMSKTLVAEYEQAFGDFHASESSNLEELRQLESLIASEAIEPFSLSDTESLQSHCNKDISAIEEVQAQVLAIFGFLGHDKPVTIGALTHLAEVHKLLTNTPNEILMLAQIQLSQEQINRLETARRCQAEVQSYLNEKGLTALDLNSLQVQELENAANTIQNAGLLGFIQPQVRRAKALYADLFTAGAKKDTDKSRDLWKLASHLTTYQSFRNDQILSGLFGAHFDGLATDFGLLERANEFATNLRYSFAPPTKLHDALLKLILSDRVEDVRHLQGMGDALKRKLENTQLTDLKDDSEKSLSSYVGDLERRHAVLGDIAKRAKSLGLKDNLQLAMVARLLELAEKLEALDNRVRQSDAAEHLLGNAFIGLDTNTAPLEKHLELTSHLLDSGLDESAWQLLTQENWRALSRRRDERRHLIGDLLEGYSVKFSEIVKLTEVSHDAFRGPPHEKTWQELEKRFSLALSYPNTLNKLVQYLRARRDVITEPMLETVLSDEANLDELIGNLKHWVIYHLVQAVFEARPVLAHFSGAGHTEVQRRYAELSASVEKLEREGLVHKLAQNGGPEGRSQGRTSDYTEMSAIRHQTGLKKPSMAIRRLLRQAPKSAVALKPCFLMSPLSVGQFLEPDKLKFDVVIIDEASQMLPEDALSAILRGSQLVVVGDPEQLPPTNFFTFNDSEIADEEADAPADSILDLANMRYKPMRELLWHYRSRHQSLIAFSNKHFYGDRLIVFPSPIAKDDVTGVRSIYVSEGEYTTGAGINIPEAKELIEQVKMFMIRHPDKSLGIATINSKQAGFIRQEFEDLYETDISVRAYIDRWEEDIEAFFVKNLENVQGDERDAIFISTVYGPDTNGNIYQRFGPINSATGYRRLNVLFTRAKHHVRLVTSLRPQDIIPGPNSHRGVHVLKDYLEYASSGRLETGSLSGGQPDSDFERFVVKRLRNAGYNASCQIGVAGYRIDIGVQHPTNPHFFILGVECDGATYHSSRFARDRDKARQQILEELGWKIYRIWSTDWFADPDGEFERLRARIEHILITHFSLEDVKTGDSESNRATSISQIESKAALPTDAATQSIPEDNRTTPITVRLGSRVTYVAAEDLYEETVVVIGRNDGSWSEPVVSMETPVARGLLGAHVDDFVTLELPHGRRQDIIITRIERPPGVSAKIDTS